MDKIKLILKEELKKERDNYLIESFIPLSEITDKDLFVEKLLETTIMLLNDGYAPEEINLIVEQEAQKSNGIWGGLKDPSGKFNLWNALFTGGGNMLKEQIIKEILSIIGIDQKWSQNLGIFFSQVSVTDLLRLFKSPNHCSDSVGSLARALLSIVVNNNQFGGQQQEVLGKGFMKVATRNLIMGAIEESNIDDIIGNKICEKIWEQ